ncbi:MAG: precorrin-6A reductase [Peptoniphilus sp.]|nr:precorrin-6A reductase [Peptoniphilus sp.]MDY3118586.1 precorrin-6A reductase [Peptoniphilus sp.]
MKLWVIGGTSESVRLLRAVDRRHILVSVAGEEGRERLPKDTDVHVGPMDRKRMVAFIRKNRIVAVVDMSHPFAKIVSREAEGAAKDAGIDYYRFRRPVDEEGGDVFFDDYESCAAYIEAHEGTFFFTTGSKHVDLFESVKGSSRHIYRVIPSSKSIDILHRAGVSMENSVAMLGPFDVSMNLAFFRHYGADFLVTKNSGAGSGFHEKIRAAEELGMTSLVIRTEEEKGLGFAETKALVERICHGIFLSVLHK